MSAGPAFGLYPSRALLPAQRLGIGGTVALHTPHAADGATLFRVSYWLPVPPVVVGAQALRLAPAALQLRFDPTEFDVPLSDRSWFPAVKTVGFQTLRIDFAWPASVTRIARPAGRDRHAVELLRADGDAVADKPTQSGITGADLAPPWVGSPLVLRIGEVVADLDRLALGDAGLVTVARGARGPVGAVADKVDRSASVGGRQQVGGLRLAGRPTSPRLKLLAERGATSTLLWQALMPGDQAQATLPERAVGVEWAAALEQLRGLAGGPDGPPERLRLDIESDAPCTVTFVALDLGLHADIELLESPRMLAFDGDRAQSVPMSVALPTALPAGAARGLRLSGRVVADGQADGQADMQADMQAGAADLPARLGALLVADRVALQPVDLGAPIALAGVAIDWMPLSDALQLRVRLLADGGATGPGSRVLAEARYAGPTAQAARLLLRWPAIDLQAQRVWIEATPLEGSGLWRFDDGPLPGAGASHAGRLDTPGPPRQHQTLPQRLRTAWLSRAAGAEAAGGVSARIDATVLADRLPAGAFEIDVPAALLPLLATRAIVFEAGIRARVSVESARLRVQA